MPKIDSKEYENLADEASQYFATGDVEHAIDLLNQAITLVQTVGDPISQAKFMNNLALYQHHVGQNIVARKTLMEGIALIESRRNEDVAEVLRNLGIVERDLCDFDSAIHHHNEALEIYKSINDKIGSARILIDLGIRIQRSDQIDRSTH